MSILSIEMCSKIICLLAAVTIIVLPNCAQSNELVYERIYSSMYSDRLAFCNKLLNKTHVIGCDGTVDSLEGILLTNVTESLLIKLSSWFKGTQQFVLVIGANETRLLHKLMTLPLDNVVGALVINSNGNITLDKKKVYSDDVGEAHGHVWINSTKDMKGAFYEHANFPMFYLENATLIELVSNCVDVHNGNLFTIADKSMQYTREYSMKPVCSALLHAPTYAPSEHIPYEQCLARKDRFFAQEQTSYCRQLDWSTNFHVAFPTMQREQLKTSRSMAMLVVRLDSMTMFTGKSPGADAVYTALLTALSVVRTLARHSASLNKTKQLSPVMITFYDGEAINNVGSFYQAYQLDHRRHQQVKDNDSCCPGDVNFHSGFNQITFDQLQYVIELNQLHLHDQKNLWLYTSSSKLKKAFANSTLIKMATKHTWPPSSLDSFKRFNASANVEMALITNHNGPPYSNRYYHSVFDTMQNMLKTNNLTKAVFKPLARHLAKVSEVVSKFLLSHLTNKPKKKINLVADQGYIEDLLNCFFIDPNCTYLQELSSKGDLNFNDTHFDQTDTLSNNEQLSLLIYHLLINSTGQFVPCPTHNWSTFTPAEKVYEYIILNDENTTTSCLRHQVISVAPYLELNVSDSAHHNFTQWLVTQMPPRALAPVLRVFLYHSNAYYVLLIVVSGLILLISLIVIYYLHDDPDQYFETHEAPRSQVSNDSLAYKFEFFASTKPSDIKSTL